MDFPPEIPVMVLPRCILFPQAMLPLYIFEERYRQMLEDSLATHRMFCVGTIRPDKKGMDEDEHQGIYDVVGVGLVRVAVGRGDGTSNLILQGLCRARVLDMFGKKPYYTARIKPLASFGGDNVEVDALAGKVAELVHLRSKLGARMPENALKFLMSLRDPESLCDLVTFTLLDDCHAKQSVLETLDLRARLKIVVLLLQKEIQRYNLVQKFKEGLDNDPTRLN